MTSRSSINILYSLLFTVLTGCGSGGGDGFVEAPSSSTISLEDRFIALPVEDLTTDEIAGIFLMREEEKLARDTYDYLYNQWGTKIFDNISNAEQKHMDAMLLLIDRYQLVDPVGTNISGVFSDNSIQLLYDLLVAFGEQSQIDALLVGAEIEDVDIYDLRAAKLINDNQDILLIYEELEKGSRNHMRSFHKKLLEQGVSYEPKYLTLDEYLEIVNSPMEKGSGG